MESDNILKGYSERMGIKAQELSDFLDKELPDCREKSLSKTKLEECVMWATFGMARSGRL